MRAVITIDITVDVPENTDLGTCYLGLPIEQMEVLLQNNRPVDAYKTLDVGHMAKPSTSRSTI